MSYVAPLGLALWVIFFFVGLHPARGRDARVPRLWLILFYVGFHPTLFYVARSRQVGINLSFR